MPTAVNNVITITTAEQLAAFAKAVNGGNNYSGVTIKLGADLDLNGDNYSWTPIGNGNYTFKGTFDGDGHTISNLKINSNAGYIGLFGCVDGTIQNVNLNNVNVSSSGPEYVGGLVARTHHNGNTKIENCTVSGTVSGTGNYTWNVGEIASNNSGTVSNCTFNGTVSGISSVGGLFGANFGNISNCTVIATVSGMSGVGGISGENFCNINGNTAIVTVNGTGNAEHLGGISGTNKQTTVTSGTISGTVSGNYYYSNRSKAVDYIGPNAENVSDNTQLYKLTLPSGVEATATGTGNKVVADNGNYYAAGTVTLKASDSTAVIKSTSYTNNDDGTVSLTPTADTNISSNDIAFYYKLTLQGVTVDSGTGYGGNYSDYYTGTVTLAAKTGYNLSQTSLTVTKAETITATLASGVYVFSTDDGATYQLATADNVKSNNYPDLQQAYQLTLPSGVTAANGVIIADGNYYMIPNSEVTLTIGTGAALVDVTGYSNVAANSSGTVPFKPTADVTINANNLYYAVSGLNNITASGGTYTTVNGTTYYAANSSVTLSSNVNGAIIGAATATGGKLNDNGDGTWTLTTTSAASTVTPTLYYSVNGIDGLNVTGGTSKTVSGTNYYKSGSSVTLSSNVNGAIIGAATATGGKLNDNGDGTWTLTTTSAASTVTPT
ncbi:MAG: hypothetical protein SR1Q7_12220, partial [Quinella sp. 1Q7]|nr:hypothetical protein [Quinella sp. 1Q7]